MMFDSFGWKGKFDGFLLGNRLHLATGGFQLVQRMDPELMPIAGHLAPATSGNLKDWTSVANMMFGATSIEQGIMLLSSFACPIWAMRPRIKRGFYASLTGGKKTGKTTAMLAAATVWGDPEGITMRSRDNMKDRLRSLSQLSDIPVIGSSLVNKDPDIAQSFVKQFVDGPRNLPKHYGVILPWCNVMLYEGTVGLHKLLESTGTDIGRIGECGFELEAKVEDEFQDKKKGRLEGLLMANSGHAGEAFIRYLVKHGTQKWVRGALDRWKKKLEEARFIPPEMGLRTEFVACLLVAAIIVEQLGILELSVSRLFEFALSEEGLLGRLAPEAPLLPDGSDPE